MRWPGYRITFRRMVRSPNRGSSLFFAFFAVCFMEVIFVKTSKILLTVGTYVMVGAASAAGAALWTNVLEDKVRQVKDRVTRLKSDKVIDITKIRKEQMRRSR